MYFDQGHILVLVLHLFETEYTKYFTRMAHFYWHGASKKH